MISFASDYVAGAHPKILARLLETNLENLPGYGTDKYCEQARQKIVLACGCPEAQVDFLVGGTQTNAVIINSLLPNYAGAVAADTGHISCHEAGAIEAGGHKVITLPHRDGKLAAEPLRRYLADFYADANYEHMVQPGLVYISHPTEYGTLYSKQELQALAAVCREYQLPLFLDGARLGYALASRQTDVGLPDIAALCDVFYIGGTKVGALCGEAVVFPHQNRPPHFLTLVKQMGALLAKGRLLGVQFDALFTDDLYGEIGRHGIEMAEQLKAVLHEKQLPFYLESPTNQQFVILADDRLAELKKQVDCGFWEKYDETHTVVRFATSWSTTAEDLAELRRLL